MPKYSNSSKERLATCHKDLQLLFNEVIKYYDVKIICGHRDEAYQTVAYNKGYSKVQYPHSKHNQYPSVAVDVAPYPINWDNLEEFCYMAGVVMTIALQMNIKLKWGGTFKDFFDGAHFQLIF